MTSRIDDDSILVCCAGGFTSVSLIDTTLTEKSRFSTPQDNSRLAAIPFIESPSRRVLAVSQTRPPSPVLIYDAESKLLLATCLGHGHYVWGLAGVANSMGASHPRIVSGGLGDCLVLIFDAVTGENIGRLSDDRPRNVCGIINVPEFELNNAVYVVGANTRHQGYFLRFDLDRQTGQQFGGLRRGSGHHTDSITGICPVLQRTALATASYDRTARLWSRQSESCVAQFQLQDEAYSCCFGDGLLLVGTRSGFVEVWDIRKIDSPFGILRSTAKGDRIFEIVRVGENKFIASSNDGSVILWNPQQKKQLAKRIERGGSVCGLCVFGMDGAAVKIEVAMEDERIRYLLGSRQDLFGVVLLVGQGTHLRLLALRWTKS